jgi:hypothetical protein
MEIGIGGLVFCRQRGRVNGIMSLCGESLGEMPRQLGIDQKPHAAKGSSLFTLLTRAPKAIAALTSSA